MNSQTIPQTIHTCEYFALLKLKIIFTKNVNIFTAIRMKIETSEDKLIRLFMIKITIHVIVNRCLQTHAFIQKILSRFE